MQGFFGEWSDRRSNRIRYRATATVNGNRVHWQATVTREGVLGTSQLQSVLVSDRQGTELQSEVRAEIHRCLEMLE